MSEDDCFWHFTEARFGNRETFSCTECGTIDKHYFRANRRKWRCRHCEHEFSCTTGTALQDRKITFKKLLMAVTIFVSSAKGCAALHMSRMLKVQPKTAFVLLGKFRECLARSADLKPLSGTVEVDGGHFGGRPRSGRVRKKPTANAIAEKVKQMMNRQQGIRTGTRPSMTRANIERRKNRRIVFVMRQHSGQAGHGASRTIVAVVNKEEAAAVVPVIEANVVRGSTIMSDENAAYTHLSANYKHEVVNHGIEYSTVDGVNENQAESYFSRLRRSVVGVTHNCRPKYLGDTAWEMGWREDVRKTPEGKKSQLLLKAACSNGLSVKWRGYWQRGAALWPGDDQPV